MKDLLSEKNPLGVKPFPNINEPHHTFVIYLKTSFWQWRRRAVIKGHDLIERAGRIEIWSRRDKLVGKFKYKHVIGWKKIAHNERTNLTKTSNSTSEKDI